MTKVEKGRAVGATQVADNAATPEEILKEVRAHRAKVRDCEKLWATSAAATKALKARHDELVVSLMWIIDEEPVLEAILEKRIEVLKAKMDWDSGAGATKERKAALDEAVLVLMRGIDESAQGRLGFETPDDPG